MKYTKIRTGAIKSGPLFMPVSNELKEVKNEGLVVPKFFISPGVFIFLLSYKSESPI